MPVTLIFGGFPRHPKILRAGEAAGWMFVTLLDYCNENGTNGFIADYVIDGLGLKNARARITKLLYGDDRLGPLLHKVDGGYEINDFLEWNQHAAALAEKQRAKSEARSKAGTKGAQSRWGKGRLHDNGDGKPDGKSIANVVANAKQPDSSSSSPSSSSSSGLESPSSAVTRREPTADLPISERQAQAITDLAARLRTFRPQWDQPWYEAQLTRLVKSSHQHPWPRIVIAMITVAADDTSRVPHRVHNYPDGYWWNDQDKRTQAAITRWVAAGHPNPMQALVR